MLPAFVTAEELAAALALAREDGWELGRQGTGYAKRALMPTALPTPLAALLQRTLHVLGDPTEGHFDLYLLRYEVGSHIPPHVDPPLASGMLHGRVNAILEQADRGGILTLDGVEVPLATGDAVRFRPDVHLHAVSAVEAGRRVLWSVGCNLPRSATHAAEQLPSTLAMFASG